MSKLFFEILDTDRRNAWRDLSRLPKGGILGGGTALALQIKHRISYDFDIFYEKPIHDNWVLKVKKKFGPKIKKVLINTEDEFTFILRPGIKVSALHYPFPRIFKTIPSPIIHLFGVRDLASSKAYTIGRRGAWRDYVDMYFILRDHLNINTVLADAEKRFRGFFNGKLFLQQLQYFEDINEFAVEFIDRKISKKEIQKFLTALVDNYVKQQL